MSTLARNIYFHAYRKTHVEKTKTEAIKELILWCHISPRPICMCVSIFICIYTYYIYVCLLMKQTDWSWNTLWSLTNRKKLYSKWRKTKTLDIYPNNLETRDTIMKEKQFWTWLTETFLPIISISPCSLFLHSFSIWRRMQEASEFNSFPLAS